MKKQVHKKGKIAFGHTILFVVRLYLYFFLYLYLWVLHFPNYLPMAL